MDGTGKLAGIVFAVLMIICLAYFCFVFAAIGAALVCLWYALRDYCDVCACVGDGPMWERLKEKQRLYRQVIARRFKSIFHSGELSQDEEWLEQACGERLSLLERLLRVLQQALQALAALTAWPILILGDLLVVQPFRTMAKAATG